MTRRRYPCGNDVRLDLDPEAELALQAFRNFLSWKVDPLRARDATGFDPPALAHKVPPAWWAYVLGATRWCPPAGEL